MRIKRLHIQNFRSIRDVKIELGAAIVFVGPNNAGKTAILEAIRIALTRRWGQRGTGFTEYDIHLRDENSDPKLSDPVVIEMEFQEDVAGEWPADLVGDLGDILLADPATGRSSIVLRVSCGWDAEASSYTPRWEFVNVLRQPLVGRSARAANLQEFFQYMPVFYLNALRDADDEFSSKSQFWGRLLRSVSVPERLEKQAKRVLDLLNRKILDSDARLGTLAETLSTISQVALGNDPGRADLRMVPLKPWDLLSRAEVIYRCESTKPYLPLGRHGQGIQSLSVIFLFRAFVEQLLGELYKPGSEPILALEEPETHLHPQACRSLWNHISELPGQTITTTHSPYLLQKVPFRDLRIIRHSAEGTAVAWLPAYFYENIPYLPGIDRILASSNGELRFDHGLRQLQIWGKLEQTIYRKLLVAYHGHADKVEIHAKLRCLLERSAVYVSDEELHQLETFARRIRGEIFFAKKWLLVEGQSEYSLMHGLAAGMDYELDANGIAVIDFQNNGNPTCFAALARALCIPWIAVFDGDPAGVSYRAAIGHRGFDEPQLVLRCKNLPNPDVEHELVAAGLQNELKQILVQLGVVAAPTMDDSTLIAELINTKSAYSTLLGQRCATDIALSQRMPQTLRQTITDLRAI